MTDRLSDEQVTRLLDAVNNFEFIHLSEVSALCTELLERRAQDNETYCAYCGARFPLDDKAATLVSEHIRTCVNHPMNQRPVHPFAGRRHG